MHSVALIGHINLCMTSMRLWTPFGFLIKNVGFSARWRTNYWFGKNAFDFLVVIHYNCWCNSRNNEDSQHFRTFCFGWVFPEQFFENVQPLKDNRNTLDIQKAHPFSKSRLLGNRTTKCVAKWIDKTGRIKSRKKWKKNSESRTVYFNHIEPTFTKFTNSLHLTDINIRSKFYIDWYSCLGSGRGAKFALSHKINKLFLPYAALSSL